MNEVARMLSGQTPGARCDAEDLLPQVYWELRKLAARRLASERQGSTLQATALVHEAYIRLVDGAGRSCWDSRGHFFAAAAEAMRRILIEHMRRKQSLKAGGGRKRVDLADVDPTGRSRGIDLLALDEALAELKQKHERAADVVKLRYFSRLTSEETARALGIATSTADNDWAYARAWLRVKLSDCRPEP
jgi:RNA polymerase sigma factor (TIGR02999 family)